MGSLNPLEPLMGESKRRSTDGGFGSSFATQKKRKRKSTKAPTVQQMLQLMYALEQEKKKHSGLRGVWNAAKGSVGSLLDIITRPSYAIAEGTREAIDDKGPGGFGGFMHGAREGITGRKKTGFGQVLDELGVLDSHKTLRGAAGLGLDVLTDPTNLLFVAAAPVTGGASLAALEAKVAARGLSAQAVRGAMRVASEGEKFSKAELQAAAKTLKDAGDDFRYHKALATKHIEEKVVSRAEDVSGVPLPLSPRRQQELDMLREAARIEEKNLLGPTKLGAQLKIPFGEKFLPESRFVNKKYGSVFVPLGLKAPTLKRIAEGKGLLGHTPGFSGVADAVGRAFKPGWGDEKWHALQSVAKRAVENLDKEYLGTVRAGLEPHALKLNSDQMLDALHFGETTKGLIARGTDPSGVRVLRKSVLKQGIKDKKITQEQANFIQDWHAVTEQLRQADKEFGVKYAKEIGPVLYVPHLYTQDGKKIEALGKNLFTVPGFSQRRLMQEGNSVKLIKELQDKGVYRGMIETDPVALLANRARRGAQAHADALVRQTVAAAEGVPTRIPNVKKLEEVNQKIARRHAELDALETATEEGLTKIRKGIEETINARSTKRMARFMEGHEKRLKAIDRDIRSLRAKLGRKRKMPLENLTAVKLLSMPDKEFKALSKRMPLNTRLRLIRARNVHNTAEKYRRKIVKLNQEPISVKERRLAREALTEERSGLTKVLVDHVQAIKQLEAKKKLKPAEERDLVDTKRAARDARKRIGQIDNELQRLKEQKSTAKRVHGSEYKAIVYQLHNELKPPKNASKIEKDLWETRGKTLERPMKKGENWRERAEVYTFAVQSDVRKALDAQIPAKKYSGIEQQLSAKLRARETEKGKLAKRQAKEEERKTKELAVEEVKLDERRNAELNKVERIAKSLASLERKRQFHRTSAANPKIPEGFVKLDRLRDPNTGVPMAVSPEIAQGLTRIEHAVRDDKFLLEFARTWNRAVSRWKVYVTVVNPGYRARNTMSDMWNMYVAGVPVWGINRYGPAAARLMRNAAKGDKEAQRVVMEAYNHGILSGLFQGDLQKVVRQMKGKEKSITSPFVKINSTAENWGRLTHYLYRTRYQNMAPQKAALEVKAAHFDYEDLTDFERKIKGYAVPFYTWTRKNIPFQITQMLSRPGRYSAFEKMRNEAEYAAGDDGSVMPDWMQQGFGFRVPWGGPGNVMMPQFGPTDLQKLTNPGQAMGMLSPLIKTPIELATNKSLLTGAPIHGSELAHPRNPISGAAASVLQFVPGANVGQTKRDVRGEPVYGPGANPLVSYAAQQTPWTNLLVNRMSNIRKEQQGDNNALFSQLFGLSTFQTDADTQAAIMQQEFNDAFSQYVRGLRDEKKLPESNRKESDFDQVIRDLLVSQRR